MAVGAPDVALFDFGADLVDAAAVCNHAAYTAVLLLRVAVVKLQYANVVFTAVNAGVLKQVAPDPHPCSDLAVEILCPLSAHAHRQRGLGHDRQRGLWYSRLSLRSSVGGHRPSWASALLTLQLGGDVMKLAGRPVDAYAFHIVRPW